MMNDLFCELSTTPTILEFTMIQLIKLERYINKTEEFIGTQSNY